MTEANSKSVRVRSNPSATGDGLPRAHIAYLVPPSIHFAGIERVVHELASGLMEQFPTEFDVTVLYCNRYDEVFEQPRSYRAIVLNVKKLRSLALSLRRAVAEGNYDVVICAQIEPAVIAWLATRGSGLKAFVPHLHGNPRIELERGGIRTRLAFTVFRSLVARRVRRIFCVSRGLGAFVSEWVGDSRLSVRYAPNPIRELKVAAVIAEKPTEGDFTFVNVGRLSAQKGQDVLIRAFAVAKASEPRLRLQIVGSGEDEAELRSLTAQLGLSQEVEFLGYNPEPATVMRQADCFVLSSRWEGLPGVLLEAFALGLPVISTDCDFGPSEVIVNGDTGLLVPVGDSARLATAMLTMAGTRDTQQQILARRTVAAAYEKTRIVALHRDLIRSLVRATG